MSEQSVYTADEFESESRYIDTLIWEAIVVVPGAKVLVCGYGPDGMYVQRAIDAGGDVTVIEHRIDVINRFAKMGAKLLRGSTSVIPAKDNTFDLAIAFHYLHEIDPFFHSQVLAELARVARRVAVVEPAPPADPLGKRIALIYSQAKRELGQFEYYQPLDYWKKLLQAVKADVSQNIFAFAKAPPREYLIDTVKLLLDTIEIEDAPREYMDELRTIAQRSDAQLLPPQRYVLVGAAVGDLLAPSFTPRLPTRKSRAIPAAAPAAPAPATPPQPAPGIRAEVSPEAGYEMPPIPGAAPHIAPQQPVEAEAVPPPAPTPKPPKLPPAEPPRPAPAAAPAFGVPGLPFGAPPAQPNAPLPPGGSPFGMPFGPPAGAPPPLPGWQWEPPEGGEDKPKP